MSSFAFLEFREPLLPVNLPIRRCPVPQQQASHRILIQRNGAHGDILMATPLLTALRETWPNAHLTWIVERKESTAIDAHPFIDEILLWDSAYWRSPSHKRMFWRKQLDRWELGQMLRKRQYDVFISFQPEEWKIVVHHCRAKTRIGVFDLFRQFRGETKTNKNTRYYTHSFTYDALPPHRTNQFLLPLSPLGLPAPADKTMQIGYTESDRKTVEQFLHDAGYDGGRLVILAPITTWKSRCWAAERYVQLGNLLQNAGMTVALICGPKECAMVEPIAQGFHQTPLLALGNLTFREMAALIARADLMVSGDTGPMHVAAAVGTPYLALFGPTPVESRAPLSGRGHVLMHPVPCGPCDREHCPNSGEAFMRCMNLITVAETFAMAQEILGQSAG